MAVITEQSLEQKLLHIHTAFVGKITKLSKDCDKASVQPLDMLKPIGKKAIKQAVLSDIPVLEHCRYRLVEEERTCLKNGNKGCTCSTNVEIDVSVNTDTGTGNGSGSGTCEGTVSCSCEEEKRKHLKKEPIKVGDICLCVCSERDNTETKQGKEAVPKLGHHSIKDAIIVGIVKSADGSSGGGTSGGGGSGGDSGGDSGGGSGGDSGGSGSGSEYDDTELWEAVNELKKQAHTHKNKAILDAITAAFTTEDKAKIESIHEHSNIDVLNATTAAFTTEEKTTYDAHCCAPHAPADAEKNAIVCVKVNGTTCPVDSSRAVNIDLASTEYDDTEIKADIAELQSKAHTHSNKAVLDATTASFTTALKTNYDKAVTHANSAHAPTDAEKNVIVGVQVNGTDLTVDSNRKVNIDIGDLSETHTHANKAILDATTASFTTELKATYDSYDNKVLKNYFTSRPTSANVENRGDGSLTVFKASDSMTVGKPTQGNGSILHMSHDNSANYAAQLTVQDSTGQVQARAQNGGNWTDWRTMIDDKNYCVTKRGSYTGANGSQNGKVWYKFASVTIAENTLTTKRIAFHVMKVGAGDKASGILVANIRTTVANAVDANSTRFYWEVATQALDPNDFVIAHNGSTIELCVKVAVWKSYKFDVITEGSWSRTYQEWTLYSTYGAGDYETIPDTYSQIVSVAEPLKNTTTSISIDSELSSTSENPVQNKVITAALNGICGNVSIVELSSGSVSKGASTEFTTTDISSFDLLLFKGLAKLTTYSSSQMNAVYDVCAIINPSDDLEHQIIRKAYWSTNHYVNIQFTSNTSVEVSSIAPTTDNVGNLDFKLYGINFGGVAT